MCVVATWQINGMTLEPLSNPHIFWKFHNNNYDYFPTVLLIYKVTNIVMNLHCYKQVYKVNTGDQNITLPAVAGAGDC